MREGVHSAGNLRWRRWGFRALAWMLILGLLSPMVRPALAYALVDTPEGGLCPHHTEHTAECGYVAAREASKCTHVHDENCGGLAPAEPEPPADTAGPVEPVEPEEPTAPETPGELSEPAGGEEPAGQPEEPSEPAGGEEPTGPAEEPSEPAGGGEPTGPAEEPQEPAVPEEPVSCNHVHDENCGYAEAREGQPCRFVCDLCVTAWEWDDPEGLLVWNENAGQWGLGLPGAGAASPVTREVLAELLPRSATVTTKAGTRTSVEIAWDFSAFPEGGAIQGVYLLAASLTGEYALTETAPALQVLVDLGGGEMYAEKYLNEWSWVIPDNSELYCEDDGAGNKVWYLNLPTNAISSRSELEQMLKIMLPSQIHAWGTSSREDITWAGFKFDQREENHLNPDDNKYYTAYWGWLNITWDFKQIPEAPVPSEPYKLTASNNAYFGVNGPAREITVVPYSIPLHLEDHIVSNPANPENVKVNLFDYWVEGYGENPTADKSTNPNGGDILIKSDPHFHEDGGDGALSGSSTEYSTAKDWNKGINEGHLLLFGDGLIHAGLWNKGAGENCRYGKTYAGMEGIVKNVLPENGYPEINLDKANAILTGDKTGDPNRNHTLIKDYRLTGDHNDGYGTQYESDNIKNLSNTVQGTWGTGKTSESLEYLFNPDVSHDYKKSYTDVTGLFQLDENGYYYYNMRENFAEFIQENGNHFILYDAPATVRTDGEKSVGNFFPFNKGSEVFNGLDGGKLTSSVYCANNAMNHHLGMTVEVDFRQPNGGMINTGSNGQQPMTFQFSGDDDVWVFIDDVLVLDLGGIHSELYGTIDFSTGDVYIGRSFATKGIPADPANPDHMVTHTNLLKLYQAASKDSSMQWSGNTYASNTSHTLKMFYLERGNYDSSIALRFNLQPLLHQQIQKVDQNGQALPGVAFALYEAEEVGQSDGAIQCLYTDSKSIDGKSFWVKQTGDAPLVTLTTDENGSAVFKDGRGDYFNFADRGDQYYVLKEIQEPAGYRKQPVDIVLYYDSKTSMLSVANRWTTGAYACSMVNVTGTSKLTYGEFTNGWIEEGTGTVSPADRAGGLVVTVPLLQQKSTGSWLALSGSNLGGFQSEAAGATEETWREGILLAALKQAAGESTAGWYLNWDGDNGRLYGALYDLPGLASRYLLNNPESGDMHMVYGIISADALLALGITGGTAKERYEALRTYVRTHTAEAACNNLAGGFQFLSVTQFNRDFRSMIYIPNERRELRVWKVDQDGKGVNGAVFDLFADSSCTGNSVATGTTANVDGRDGVLVFSPTGNGTDGQAKMVWANSSSNTQYYLKERSAPSGYRTNNTVIPVVVGQYSIYADAGKPNVDDGVTVMAGVGRLTQTMRQYAAGNDVDITLQDITAFMQTQPSGSFQADGWSDAALAGTNVLRSMNLHFGKNALVDYGLHDEDGGENLSPVFVTDSGFVRARVQQMAESGKYENANEDVNKDNLGDTDLTNLFSLLNIVVVTDQTESDTQTGQLTISKTVSGSGLDTADYIENFTFTVELRDANGQLLDGAYEYRFYGADKAGFIDKEHKTLLLHHDDSVTILGLPEGTRYTVTETKAAGWHVKPTDGTVSGTITAGRSSEARFENSKNPFPEEPDQTSSLTISKAVTGENLTGDDLAKEFTFTVNLTDSSGTPLTGSYPYSGSRSGAISDGGTITLKHGESVTITGLPVGTRYTVKENTAEGWTAAPANGISGEIGEELSTAAFTNTKGTDQPESETGSLTISKTVAGEKPTAEDLAQSFTFTVNLADKDGVPLTGSYPYTYSDARSGSISNGGTVTLKHGESVTITGLPDGTLYAVAEAPAAGWTAAFSGANGPISKNRTSVAAFTNAKIQEDPEPKTGSLTISKTIAGEALTEDDRIQGFLFTVNLMDANGQTLAGSYEYRFYGADTVGYINSEHNTLLLHHGESVTITGLPFGTRYTVTEIQAVGWTASSFGADGSISKDQTSAAVFTNTKDPVKPDDPQPDNPPPVTPPDNPPPVTPPDNPPPVTPPDNPPPVTPPDNPPPDNPPPDNPPPVTPPPETPGPENPPVPPETPETPEPPEAPSEEIEERLTELPDPNDPNSPDIITIWVDGVPRTYRKIWDPEKEEWVYILEDDLPLANADAPLETPATGDGSRPGLWMLLNGMSLSGLAAIYLTKLRKKKDSK